MDAHEMTGAEILALSVIQARILFPGDEAAVSARFKALARAWHPDRNREANASAVFAHIAELHEVAKRVSGPAGLARMVRTFHAKDGHSFRFSHLRSHTTDFGEILIGSRFIAHVVPADLSDLAARAAAFMPRFADDGMRTEMERFLPRRHAVIDTAEGMVFVETKTPDQVLLRDLLRMAPFDPRHAAWMATRLVNLACWLQWSGIAHGAIGPDTLLVSPEFHSVALTGPFLSMSTFGKVPPALPERTLSVAPRYALDGATADVRLDPELVRQTLRECLGDPAGTRLAANPDFPMPFANWLLMPAAKGAQGDFPAWEQARDASFGARRFVQWDLDPAALMAA